MAYFPYVTFVSVISFNDIRFVSYIVLKFVGVSSKHLRIFLGSPRQSSDIFGHLRKFSEILGKCSGTFVWCSEQFWKIFGNLGRWSEIFGKSSKTPSSACLYNKKNITRRLEDMNFIFSRAKTIFYSLAALVRKILFCHSKIKFISSHHRVISSI